LGAYKALNMRTKYSTVSAILESTLSVFKFDKAEIYTSPRVRLGSHGIREVGIGAFVRIFRRDTGDMTTFTPRLAFVMHVQ